jgi:alkylation response protein AidB-like acyl-CoA dehydrogenase
MATKSVRSGKTARSPCRQASRRLPILLAIGLARLAASTEDGGQGLPTVLEAMLYEMLSAANMGWTMAPGLLHGAYECIKHHASDELKAQYLEKVATGEWLATMCLTEPHAGSDLGLARTKAVPLPDGSTPSAAPNFHLGWRTRPHRQHRAPGAGAPARCTARPQRSVAVFGSQVLPRRLRSRVHCDRIEEKMGLHGSPTCVMRFDEAVSSIVGEPGKGLNAMFVMMNAARLHVALQGIGLLDAAWQKADAYAQERRQMRAPGKGKSAAQADFIGEHPAMRRILDTQRAWVDAGRVLAYRTALELDLIKHSTDAARKPPPNAGARWSHRS